MGTRHILVVTGASGAGKTSAVRALEARGIEGVRCFYFDSIGVPSAEVMERVFGGGEQWQAHATAEWLARLDALSPDIRVAVLDGQTRPSFVFDAAKSAQSSDLHVVLLDCSAEARSERLRGPRRQPELANDRMTSWAAYLRGQADVRKLPVIETTTLTVDKVADELEALLRALVSPLRERSVCSSRASPE
jgi:RNase adaptor protein for sRNA GlmZ degradation